MMTVNQHQLPGAFGQELCIQDSKTSTGGGGSASDGPFACCFTPVVSEQNICRPQGKILQLCWLPWMFAYLCKHSAGLICRNWLVFGTPYQEQHHERQSYVMKKNKPPKLCIKFLIKKSLFKSDLAHLLPSVSFSMPFIKCYGDLGPAPLGVSCYRIYHAWQAAVVTEGCWVQG